MGVCIIKDRDGWEVGHRGLRVAFSFCLETASVLQLKQNTQ